MSVRRILALLVTAAGIAPAARGQDGGVYHWARVSAVQATAVSLDVGSADGVRRWSRLEVVRRGVPVALLQVTSVGDHETRCDVMSRGAGPVIGDSVRFFPAGLPRGSEPVAAAVPPPPAARAAPPASVPAVPHPPAVQSPSPGQPLPASQPSPVVQRAPAAASQPQPQRSPDSSRAPVSPPVTSQPPPVAQRAPTAAPQPQLQRSLDSSRAPVSPPVASNPPSLPRPTQRVPQPAVTPPPPPPSLVAANTNSRDSVSSPPPTATPSRPPVVAVSVPAPAPSAPAPAGGRPRTARVTFLTTVSVYIDAGKADGLAEGTRVDVLHGGQSIAELKVAFVSTHQASCQVVSKTATIAVGDTAQFVPVAGPAVAARGDSTQAVVARPAPQPTGTSWRRSDYGRLRGRVGFYYLTVQQRDSFGGWFTQPSGEIRLSGSGLGGSPIGLVADIRSRRLVQGLPGGTNNTVDQNRIYQALLYWQAPGSPFRVTTGRQYAPGISSVGLIDGAALEVSQPVWDVGGFAGTAPDPITLGFSGDSVTELGGYVRRHNRVGSLTHWSVTAGASGSYVSWHTNREFFYAQGNYQSRRVSVYAVQEVDYYRPWRRVGTGEQALSLTSTFMNFQFQATNAVSLNAGVDNRRNVRLYQYVINPAILFDDTFRRGVWAGASARVARHFQVAVDVRANHDNTNGDANTYTLGLGADRLTPIGLSLRSRTTRYTTGPRQGWLNSLTLGLEPFGRGSVQLTSGWRTEHDTSTTTLNVRWLSADVDVSLMRSLFAIFSAYGERGGIEAHDLLYAGLSYRF